MITIGDYCYSGDGVAVAMEIKPVGIKVRILSGVLRNCHLYTHKSCFGYSTVLNALIENEGIYGG